MLRAFGWALALQLCTATSAFAGGLDINGWLSRPGVKLLAVEFYATWCKPCMEAVPRWKALHDKYRKDGLRLVVVATQDPGGSCANPGWNPDDVVCDDDGRLAERLGANSLPAAFLWSWQGNLLASRAHVEDVEPMIESWLRETPRVDVQLGDVQGAQKSELDGLIRSRLRDEDKLIVIASEAERKRLAELRKKSYESGFDEKLQCEVGKDLSANSLLDVQVTAGERRRLRLGLLSAERGCLVASSVVDFNPNKSAVSVAEAVTGLISKLRGEIQMPGASQELGEYARMKREMEAAKADASKKREADDMRARAAEEAFKIVREFALMDSLPIRKRIDAVKKYLSDFPGPHPFVSEAESLLADLERKAQPPQVSARPVDSDQDGVPDPEDACRELPESINGYKDDDGCPDELPTTTADRSDDDADGIPNANDVCPREGEDVDGFEDEDGCSDPDNDHDGISDAADRCVNAAETKNGFQDGDGCPDIIQGDERLEVKQPIRFRTATARLLPESSAALEFLASRLREFPNARLRIEVHTDSQGSDSKNLALSQQRADAIKTELANRGIAASRLEANGWGESKPIASNATEEGRAANRRIEFWLAR